MKTLLLVALLIISCFVQGQNIEFVVYHAKGKVMKKSSKAGPVKKGDRLFAADVLQVPDNAELVLICKNYNTVKVKGKGNHAVRSLLRQCQQEQATFTSSYFHYIWDELTHVHGSPEKDPKKYMRNTGAVSRGCPFVQINLPVDTIHYYSGQLPVFWKATYATPYISIYDDALEGALLVKEIMGKGPMQVESVANKLKREGVYYWQITDADGSGCERHYLRIWNAGEYKEAVDRVLQNAVGGGPAETAYMKAFLLEEQHFLAEAFSYYQLAAQLDPQNTIYKKAQLRFYE